ncbi:lipocalin family protein [Lutimaribacter sp. EGI FJ00015]|uniref:Lipocalin family protein n=1 Tax=Lutimaribacter degradans TaxID=2945989 RepID=A0ACC5ZRE4_9RHOB|nr:lipocalin family protein [Lutimaribacter sp. EGI FJ00013]MCM2560743.1 lipocalin family protein [Lutimaribacter sp. EGI FJ00013]MCO0612311.1 lipocalin family protein [Lutimaribacter sp. EGI FJ00015]MCO0634568.1 lipocalin family protein [Lutimaribacter sp. EGI FJ00014]
MYRTAALALALLAACGPSGAPTGPAIYRDAAAPISSQVDVTAARLSGDWHVRVGPVLGPVVAGDRLRLDALQAAGPGRFKVTRGPLSGRVLWVLWLDADNRTAALGSPDGKTALVLDRAPTGGADRIAAARKIMAWQGYDMARLKTAG